MNQPVTPRKCGEIRSDSPFLTSFQRVMTLAAVRTVAAVVFIAMITAPAMSQSIDTVGLDLLSAWQAARKKDSTLAAARFQEEAAQLRIPQAQAALLPSASATGQIARQWADTANDSRKGFTSQNYALNLSYPLYRLPAKESLEQAKLASTQAAIQASIAEQELLLKVAQAYLETLGGQDTLRAAQAQNRASREQRQNLQKSFDAGNAARIDLQDAIARHDIALAQELTARNELEIRIAALAVLTGRFDAEIRRLRSDVELSIDATSHVSDWVRQARTANLAVQVNELAGEIAQREVAKQNAGHRPSVDLVSSLTRSSNSSVNFIGINQNNAQVGVQVTIPLFNGGAISAKTREAVALFNKASAELETARDLSEQVTRQALVRIASGRGLMRALESAVNSSQIALDTTVLAYKAGSRVNLDVLNAQQQLFSTRRDLAKARYDFLMDSLKLKQLSGSLRETDLIPINALLIPLQN